MRAKKILSLEIECMIIETPPPVYEISTRNRKIKYFLNGMYDVYGIKDYSVLTPTSWRDHPVEIFPVRNSAYEKALLGLNRLDSIDELVLHQYLRLENELIEIIACEKSAKADTGVLKNFKDGESYLYLVKEEKPEKSYKLFMGFLADGINGLCISKTHPEQLTTSYGLNSKNVIWLCNAEGENNINPGDLSKLLERIHDFILKNGSSVILLEGLEYLISHNGLKKVLNILSELNAQIKNDSMFILPIHPKALRKIDFDRLEKSIVSE